MPIGTVHSICRRILADRRFSRGRTRPGNVPLVDELDQYFTVHDQWEDLLEAAGFERNGNETITQYLTGGRSKSRHEAAAAAISFFNRLSEECLDPKKAAGKTSDATLQKLLRMYQAYRDLRVTDLSLLQQAALEHCLANNEVTSKIFRHVIVDEYQDTNHVQESLFFHLADGYQNLCVVGDDDQALYRFRGATVENLVEFVDRCREKLGQAPRMINLGTNYRSQRKIVEFYSKFIRHPHFDWSKGPGKKGAYRIESKTIVAHSKDDTPAVVASARTHPADVCAEVAGLVRRLLDEGKLADPNQVAFLYPRLKYKGKPVVPVERMLSALKGEGLKVYAPRAGQFLDVKEALDIFGVLLVLFGSPVSEAASPGMRQFFDWVTRAHERGKVIVREDRALAAFIKERQEQIERAIADRQLLVAEVGKERLKDQITGLTDPIVDKICGVKKLSPRATGYLRRGLRRLIEARRRAERPLTVGYVVNRMTTLDWGVLDIFYELTGFEHFRRAFDLAAQGDEGPICNLALISKYLARFQARQKSAVLSASFLQDGKFVRTFFNSFVYALWRRGESEYEDADDPFPKGRIPFLTVHQAKGLEFPVVVLGNPRKSETVQEIERIVRPLLERRQGEPLDRIARFDAARMFYVALSRPKNLLVLCHFNSKGNYPSEPFKTLLADDFPRIADLDLDDIPRAESTPEEELPKTYSYTGDYLAYRACPRRYMFYRRYDFAPARADDVLRQPRPSDGRGSPRVASGAGRGREAAVVSREAKKSVDRVIHDAEVEERIREFFERNYDLLRQEGGHVLAEGAKRQALDQVLCYWRKLKAIATSVTETEVKLALPGLKTPKGRPFVLEGVVDIVREGDKVLMYDLKTHEESEVRAERKLYEDQLNVYAYIWKRLRNQGLDGTAIVATRLPPELREALKARDPKAINAAMAAWDPVVDLPFDEDEVARTIEDFGRCVDAIEDGEFEPPSVDELDKPHGTRRRKDHGSRAGSGAEREPTFAEIHCQNCDARFSCSSYQTYREGLGAKRSKQHAAGVRNDQVEQELDLWIEENLTES
jgi:DNA helicase-2/ATP-dependent DNA helicase PcrA